MISIYIVRGKNKIKISEFPKKWQTIVRLSTCITIQNSLTTSNVSIFLNQKVTAQSPFTLCQLIFLTSWLGYLTFWIRQGVFSTLKQVELPTFSGKYEQPYFFTPVQSENEPLTFLDEVSHWKKKWCHGWWYKVKQHSSTFNFWPLITHWDLLKPHFTKMLNDSI